MFKPLSSHDTGPVLSSISKKVLKNFYRIFLSLVRYILLLLSKIFKATNLVFINDILSIRRKQVKYNVPFLPNFHF